MKVRLAVCLGESPTERIKWRTLDLGDVATGSAVTIDGGALGTITIEPIAGELPLGMIQINDEAMFDKLTIENGWEPEVADPPVLGAEWFASARVVQPIEGRRPN